MREKFWWVGKKRERDGKVKKLNGKLIFYVCKKIWRGFNKTTKEDNLIFEFEITCIDF